MAELNIFKYAAERKLRYSFRGSIATENLYELSVEDLDLLYGKLRAEVKESGKLESLLHANKVDKDLEVKIEIVKTILLEKIAAAEKVKKAKKLLKLEVDLGYEKRQVVSGIAKFYEPEDLVGKKIILVCNLKPATLCGIESNGMILASGEEEIRVVFLDPATGLGERIR